MLDKNEERLLHYLNVASTILFLIAGVDLLTIMVFGTPTLQTRITQTVEVVGPMVTAIVLFQWKIGKLKLKAIYD